MLHGLGAGSRGAGGLRWGQAGPLSGLGGRSRLGQRAHGSGGAERGWRGGLRLALHAATTTRRGNGGVALRVAEAVRGGCARWGWGEADGGGLARGLVRHAARWGVGAFWGYGGKLLRDWESEYGREGEKKVLKGMKKC